MKNENGDSASTHEFGITSLKNKRDLLQKDDAVTFRVDESNRAVEVNIKCNYYSNKMNYIFLHSNFQINPVRLKKKANVDSIKGQFGFLDFEVEDGKKLFFHMSEVQGNGSLYPGDVVEFSIVTNQVSYILSITFRMIESFVFSLFF